MNNRRSLLLASIVIAVLQSLALGADSGRDIVAEVQRRTVAQSQRYDGTLQVIDNKGTIADKRWTFVRIGSHGTGRTIVRFTAPAEVKGVALLVLNHPDRASDQWMWTPALQRERRIAVQDRATRFFGTDFSFEDLEERDVDQFNYRLMGGESLDGVECWRIESTPARGRVSQYSRSEVWVWKDLYVVRRIDLWTRSELVRRLLYSDFEEVANIWTARRLEMTDFRRKSRTILKFEHLEYNVPMQESDFSVQALRRES